MTMIITKIHANAKTKIYTNANIKKHSNTKTVTAENLLCNPLYIDTADISLSFKSELF